MTNACPLSGLGMILAITLGTTGAHARQNRADTQGYPCITGDRLTITQDDQGYSIRNRPVPTPTRIQSATAIQIGSALRVDTKIFSLADRANAEVYHAPRR